MPQAKKDSTITRAQEKESKRARGALSCAECRRLKLKCDKTVPCSSCKRRGCAAICPNGSLVTGQGTRFVLADTDKLHQKIATMSDRIRDLENALSILQSTVTSEPHPLLDRDLLKIKSSIELHAAIDDENVVVPEREAADEDVEEYIDAFGTLAIREDGAATFYGRSAGSESLLVGEGPSAAPSPVIPHAGTMAGAHALATALGPGVLRRQENPSLASFAASFPFSPAPTTANPAPIDLAALAARLPPYAEALRLCELYLAQAPWFFGAVSRSQITTEVLPLWFPDCAGPQPPPAREGSPPPVGTAHDLALLYVILCFGALGDTNLPLPTSTANVAPVDDVPADGRDAEHYYRLTKSALTLAPVLEGPPSVATVQTLALMGIFEGLCAGENSIESTWAIFGLSTKLAQSIGLHRDCARWRLRPAEVQKRRALFWELFTTDCWQALATGRLPTFSLPFVDCELPQDVDQTLAEDGTPQPSFPYWKARFGAECVSAVVQGTLTSRAPKYSIILELDRKVRDMEFPKYATGPPPEGAGLSQTMSHFMPFNYRHLTLLYIHRCFFAHAIQNHPNDPIKSPYAPSFLAGYRSACDLLTSLRVQFNTFPEQISRFWVLWTHAFSSAIMLASVVTHATHSKVAPAALIELGKACELFEAGAQISASSRASKFVPILQRVSKRAIQVYEDARSGAAPPIPNNIFEPSRQPENDELAIFSGKTHTLTTKNKTTPAPTRSSTGNTSSSQRSLSDSPSQIFTDNPSFVGVHPSLVNELNVFDGTLNAQIQAGYAQYPNGFGGHAPFPQEAHGSRYRMPPPPQQQPYGQHMQEDDEYRRPPTREDARFSYPYPSSHRNGFDAYNQPMPPPQHSLSHSNSQRSLHHAYSHSYDSRRGDEHTQFRRHDSSQLQSPIDGPSHSHSQNGSSQATTPETVYMDDAEPLRSPYQTSSPAHQYWPSGYAAPAPVAEPLPYDGSNGHDIHRHRMQLDHHTQQLRQINLQLGTEHDHHYTPDAALRGIAAEDPRLQEHWQAYMSKVGSPRMIQDP